MNVVVVTVAHRGDDARIVHRQIRSLLEAGHSVTLVAPDPGEESRRLDAPGLERIVVQRAVGRRRMSSWWQARRVLSRFARVADVILIHDPELVPVVGLGRWRRAVLVWDVHEDFVASVADRRWLPKPARPVVRFVLRVVQRFAERRFRIVIAEHSYGARFVGAPVVPNSTWVVSAPEPVADDKRVVYVGRVSTGRGAAALVSLGDELTSRRGPRLVVVGPADRDVEAIMRDAAERGVLDWRGPLANPEAMRLVDGAVAGMSLLLDEPNYRHSQPTKIMEYLAHGTPTITTPLPLAAELVGASGGGVVTRHWNGPDLVTEVADAVMAFATSDELRNRTGITGWTYVRDNLSWNADGASFVRLLEEWVQETRRSTAR
jgi:glycosyltransferase involved in cell wall biosynthesis